MTATGGRNRVDWPAMVALAAAMLAATSIVAWLLSPAARADDLPDVAEDGSGNAQFVWRFPLGARQVVAERAFASQTLTDPDSLSFLNRVAQAPEVDSAADGTATAVWDDATSGHAQARRRFVDGAHSRIIDISGATVAKGATHVAVASNGDAAMTWIRTNGTGHQVLQTRTLKADGTLTAIHGVSPSDQNASNVAVAAAPNGDATYAWVVSAYPVSHMQTRTRAATGVLGAIQDASDPIKSTSEVGVGVDASGNATFVWISSDGGPSIIKTRRRTAAGTLGAIQDLTPAGSNQTRARVAVNANDQAAFAWVDRPGSFSVVRTRTRDAAGTLTALQSVSATDDDGSEPSIGIDGAGVVSYAWARSDSVVHDQTRTRLATGALTGILNLSDTTTSASAPRTAVAPNGDAAFVWSRAGIVEARLFESGAGLGPVVPISS